jgi:AcrR family transcriptional regulator
MPREVPADRLEQLVDCATRVFIEQGYRRTQMTDVAGAMGVAKGTLYLSVEGKEALFDLALRYADAERPFADRPALPVRTPRPGATLRYVREELARHQGLPALAAALGRRCVIGAAAELGGIVRELHDTLARNRRRIKLVDRSARDYPELAALWFEGARGGLLALLVRYVDDRIRRRLFRPVPDTAAAARLIVETTVFWAVHRHWDAHPRTVDEDLARETVVHFIVGALARE